MCHLFNWDISNTNNYEYVSQSCCVRFRRCGSVGNMESLTAIPQQAWNNKPKSSGRSRVSNGSKLLPLADGRSVTARRFRDLYEDIAADLGGLDRLSEGQKQLIRRAAMISAESERLEALATRGEGEFDLELYGMLCDRLGRLFGRIELERRQRDTGPSMKSRCQHHHRSAGSRSSL